MDKPVLKSASLYITFLILLFSTICTAQNPAEAIHLGDAINSSYAERVPLISLDGKVLYFARKAHPQNMGEADKDDIWVSYLNESTQTWTKAVNVGAPLNNDGHNFVVSVNTSADAMYLANDYNSNLKDAISYTTKKGRKWAQPKRLDIPDYKNKSPFVSYHVSKDEKYLLIAAEQEDTQGGRDFYVSFKTKKGWMAPLNLGADINTSEEENSIFLAADNVTVYFSSKGHRGLGGYDLFMSKRLDESWTKWSTPINLGKTINTPLDDLSVSIPASGDFAYIARGPIENTDLYKIEIPRELKPEPVTFIQAQLVDAETKKTVNGSIYFESLSNNDAEELRIAKGKSANYIAQRNEDMSMYAQVKGYFPVSDYHSVRAEHYEAVDGDNDAYYLNSEVQVLQNKLDEIQRELKKLTEKKLYLSKQKSKKKTKNASKKKASNKAGAFKDVGDKDDELSSLKSKYEQHYQEDAKASVRNSVEEKASDSDALKKARDKYQQHFDRKKNTTTDAESSSSSSDIEVQEFSQSVFKNLFNQYFLSVVRVVKKQESVNLSTKDTERLELQIKTDIEAGWKTRVQKLIYTDYQNKVNKEVREQVKRAVKDDFVESLRTEITIIIKLRKEKILKLDIDKQLAIQPKKKPGDNIVTSKTISKEGYQEVDKQLNLVSLKKGATLTLNNIFFDTNEATIKPQSNLELERIFFFIAENTNLKIEIGGHANGWCSPDFASALSEDRAEAIHLYLIDKGIKEDKISYKGYGKSDPIASNETATGRKQNQRVELKIIDIIE